MRQRISSLRFFITSTIVLIVSVVLLCSTLLYYFRTSTLLKENYQRSFTNQLNKLHSSLQNNLIPLNPSSLYFYQIHLL